MGAVGTGCRGGSAGMGSEMGAGTTHWVGRDTGEGAAYVEHGSSVGGTLPLERDEHEVKGAACLGASAGAASGLTPGAGRSGLTCIAATRFRRPLFRPFTHPNMSGRSGNQSQK